MDRNPLPTVGSGFAKSAFRDEVWGRGLVFFRSHPSRRCHGYCAPKKGLRNIPPADQRIERSLLRVSCVRFETQESDQDLGGTQGP